MASMTSQKAISVRGLRKAYGSQKVLDGIDIDVPVGSVFALLGPNGADPYEPAITLLSLGGKLMARRKRPKQTVGLQALEKELRYEWRCEQWLNHEAERAERSSARPDGHREQKA
jgi:ABC-type hemin transport system ATPase subunit